jgi:membrane-associated phospholipid phosphatase
MPLHHRWLINILLLIVLGLVTFLATNHTFSAEILILNDIHSFQTPLITNVMKIITNIASPFATISILATSSALLIWRGRKRDAFFVCAATIGALLISLGLKLVFLRPRPQLWTHLVIESDFSFPSGHATITMAFALSIIFLAWPTKWRWPVIIVGAIAVILVGISRLYLGVHFPTDVLAGWLVSAMWVRCIWWLLHTDRKQLASS